MSRSRKDKKKSNRQQAQSKTQKSSKASTSMATKDTTSGFSQSTTSQTTQICQHYVRKDKELDFTCNGHHTGLLTNKEIQGYGIIKGIEEDCLQITSYDLRIGEGHMVYDSEQRKWVANWLSPDKSPTEGNPPYVRDGSSITIPKFGMALIQLRETIDLLSCIKDKENPVMICGHFDLKLSRVREGLISQGKLFCYLFNQTGDDIDISYTDTSNNKVATIEFQYTSCLSQCDEKIRQHFLTALDQMHAKFKGPYCNQHGIRDVRYFDGVPNELGKLPKHGGRVKDEINASASNKTKMIAFICLLLGIIATLVAVILPQNMHKNIIETWVLIGSNQAEVTLINTEVNRTKKEIDELWQKKIQLQEQISNAEIKITSLNNKLSGKTVEGRSP